MNYSFVELPLYEDKDYRYQIALEGESYTLRFTYNTVMKLYTLSIYDADSNVICSGVGVVPNYPISDNLVINGLSGFFFLSPKATTNTSAYKTYPDKLSTYYNLSYIYNVTV